jgi:hypothetical protein
MITSQQDLTYGAQDFVSQTQASCCCCSSRWLASTFCFVARSLLDGILLACVLGLCQPVVVLSKIFLATCTLTLGLAMVRTNPTVCIQNVEAAGGRLQDLRRISCLTFAFSLLICLSVRLFGLVLEQDRIYFRGRRRHVHVFSYLFASTIVCVAL